MAQLRYFDWRAPPRSAWFNQRWEEAFGNVVLNGLNVVPGTSGMQVTIEPGAGLVDGLTFVENATLTDVLTLSLGHGSYARWDAVVARYVREETSPPPEVTYHVLQGTPAPNPEKPTPASYELVLAYIYVPAMATSIANCTIENQPKLRDRIATLIRHGALTAREQPFFVEGQIWERDADPTTDPTAEVKVGDLWIDTDDPSTVFFWDGTQWVDMLDWNNLKNRPTSMPPEVHDLAGPYHSGSLPIDRVSGHTAFGPAAHQEAFAGATLRRP